VKNESPAAKSAAEFSAEFRSDPERNRLYLESKARLSNETAMQERAALSELELASIRQWIEVGPGFTPAYAELSGLLATIDERDELIEELESRAGMDGAAIKAACKEIEVREEALQRVHRLNHFSVMVPRVSSNSLSSAPMEVVSWADMDGAAIKAACKEIEVREEALQRVHRLNHFSVMVPRVSSNSLSSAPMEVVSWADILTAIEVKQ
jgi:hypothetical protein